MSNDAAVTKDLLQTLEDGKDGFTLGADKLEKDGETELAATFRTLGQERAQLANDLQTIAASYGGQLDASGSVAAKVHRGWLAVRDALSGSDPAGVLAAAEQGEDHAVSDFETALTSDISPELKTTVERQLTTIRAAHDQVRALRDGQV